MRRDMQEEAVMAAARDQAARILRPEPDAAESAIARDTSESPAEQARSDSTEETVGRRPADTPDEPAIDQPAGASTADAASATPKSGKRKLVLLGIIALLALAAAGYGGYYVLVGRFYVSTDDAYVRANIAQHGGV